MSFRVWGFIAAGLFVAGMVLGLTVRGGAADFITRDVAALKELSAMLGPFKVSTAVFIFFKNVTTLLVGFLFSPILLLAPVLSLVLNGWLLAFIGVLAAQQKSLGFVLAAVLPHGILEIPALIIGEAAALSFGATVIVALIFREKRGRLLPNLKKSLRYLALACILLLPAAVIETYVTPIIASRLQ
ncbi:MAG: stage II sporulation protein M [Chloroflexi bacterium]|nr:stage II sporulation protein M [Chloroflexota bacterium]